MGNHERPRYSRFQVLTEGRPAWAQDDRGAVFYFDSLRFWQPKRRGRRQIGGVLAVSVLRVGA